MKIRKTTKSYETVDMTPDEYAYAVAEYIGPKVLRMIADEASVDGLGLEFDNDPTEEERGTMMAMFIDKLAAWLEDRLSSMYSCEKVDFCTIIENQNNEY